MDVFQTTDVIVASLDARTATLRLGLQSSAMFQTIIRRRTTIPTIKWLCVVVTACCLLYFTHQSSKNIFVQQSNDSSISDIVTIDRKLFDYLAIHLRDRPYDGVGNYTRFMTAKLDLKALQGVEPLVPGMGTVVNDVLSFQYSLNIGPCRQKSGEEMVNESSLFIAVISAPNNLERRAMIRQTWPSHFKNQTNVNHRLGVVGFGFVIGLTVDEQVQQKVQQESDEYGDILQIDVVDKYVDLSIKVASLLNWVNQFCQQVDYVLKADDDVYVNVHNLATVLHSLTPSEPSIYGHPCGGNIPMRSGGKWATTFENWPWQRFPIYYQGAGIVIAGSAVLPLLAAMQTTPYFIWDDMYLVGLCAAKAGVRLRTSNQIFIDLPSNYADPCFVRNTVMWTTRSADVLNMSHHVSQGFYGNPKTASCVVGNDTNPIFNEPARASEFPFNLI